MKKLNPSYTNDMDSMSFNDFFKDYTGKAIDWDGKYGSQCVDLFRYYLNKVINLPQPPGVRGAADLWDVIDISQFEKIKNTPNGVPIQGDIAIWNTNAGGGFGHVAIIDEANVNYFYSYDQNWSAQKVTREKHNYSNLIGWLRPKAQNYIADWVAKNSDQWRALCWDLGYADAENTNAGMLLEVFRNKETDIKLLSTKLDNRIEQAKRLEGDVKELTAHYEEIIKQLRNDIPNINEIILNNEKRYDELFSKYDEAKKEIGRLKNQLTEYKAGDYLSQMSLWDALALVLSKIKLT